MEGLTGARNKSLPADAIASAWPETRLRQGGGCLRQGWVNNIPGLALHGMMCSDRLSGLTGSNSKTQSIGTGGDERDWARVHVRGAQSVWSQKQSVKMVENIIDFQYISVVDDRKTHTGILTHQGRGPTAYYTVDRRDNRYIIRNGGATQFTFSLSPSFLLLTTTQSANSGLFLNQTIAFSTFSFLKNIRRGSGQHILSLFSFFIGLSKGVKDGKWLLALETCSTTKIISLFLKLILVPAGVVNFAEKLSLPPLTHWSITVAWPSGACSVQFSTPTGPTAPASVQFSTPTGPTTPASVEDTDAFWGTTWIIQYNSLLRGLLFLQPLDHRSFWLFPTVYSFSRTSSSFDRVVRVLKI